MLWKQYYEKLLTTNSDPKLVAHAYEQYFKRVYERSVEKAQALNDDKVLLSRNDDNQSPNLSQDLFALQLNQVKISGQETLQDGYNAIISFSQLQPLWLEKMNQDVIDEANSSLTLVNEIDHVTFTVPIEEVSIAIGSICDNAYITWQSFYSVVNSDVQDAVSASQNFINNVNVKLNNSYGSLKQSVVDIYNVISNQDTDIVSKIESLCQFSGLNQASENPDMIEDAEIDLANYTGINPVIGWLNGINWKKGALGILSIPLLVQKFINRAVTTIFQGVSTLFNKVFTWVGNWFHKTFVDPVDYKVDSGDSLEYFKLPLKTCIPFNIESSSTYSQDFKKFIEINGINSEFWINDGTIFQHISFSTNPEYPNLIYLLSERYVKPIDPRKIYGILDNDFPSWTRPNNSNHYELTKQQYLELRKRLAEADLSISKGASEKDVFVGIALAYAISYRIALTRISVLNEYKNDLNSFNEEVDLSSQSNAGIWLTEIYNFLRYYLYKLEAIPYIHPSQLSLRGYGLIISATELDDLTITNNDFINILTIHPILPVNTSFQPSWRFSSVANPKGATAFDNELDDIGGYDSIASSNVIANDIIGDAFVNSEGKSTGLSVTEDVTAIMVLYYSRNVHNGDDYDGAFVPYVTVQPYFNKNVSVCTDAENIKKVSNFLMGAAITTVVIATSIVVGASLLKISKKVNQLSSSADFLSFQYGEQLNSGRTEEALATYKQWKTTNVKRKILSTLLGRSGEVADNLSFDLSTITSNSSQDIAKLIKG